MMAFEKLYKNPYTSKYQRMTSGTAVNRKCLEYSCLLGYCKYDKFKLQMQRNADIVNILKQSVTEMIDPPQMNDTDDKDKDQVSEAKYKHVEEITHLYDALLQDATAIIMLPGGPKDHGQDDDNDNNEYYMARIYTSDTVVV